MEDPDPVIERYKRDVDRTLLRENLRLSEDERIRELVALLRFAEELWRAGARLPSLGEIAGGGRFEDLRPHSIHVNLFGIDCLCLGLERLIEVKRAAGRPRDLEAVAELEVLREERDRHQG